MNNFLQKFTKPLLAKCFLVICLSNPLLFFGQKKNIKTNLNASPPNIVWFVTEDQSPEFFPMYGDSTISLPNLEALALEGVIFNNAYTPVPVCAPTRSSLITGMYPTTLGTHNMRTYNGNSIENRPELGIPNYSPVVPENTHMFTEYLREKGYYCTNNYKEDYNFRTLESAWDDSSDKATWRNRPDKNKPFFSVFNFNMTHEGAIWRFTEDELFVLPDSVPVPPIFPDNNIVRKDLAINYSNLKRMDDAIGKLIVQLKEDGLYENTIIFFYGDHGGPFPRYKRALYETGTKVPLVIKFQGNEKESDYNDDLVSFIDFAPTLLSWAGIKPPENMQGKALFGMYQDTIARKSIFTTADRFGEGVDRLRAVRSKDYKYIRNFNVNQSNALALKYRDEMPLMRNLKEMHKNATLDSVQELWFRVPKPEEELYNLEKDPYELINLANRKEHKDTLVYLRNLLDNWIEETGDLGRIPEKELIAKWLVDGQNPQLEPLKVMEQNQHVYLTSNVHDATIIWKFPDAISWNIYNEPLLSKQEFEAKVVRIGFKDSPILRYRKK